MAEVEKRTLSFGITGEFITKVAREWFFIEHKPYSVVEDLMLSCMCGTDTPEGQLKLMAQDVLIGKAEFRGNSWDGSFRYVILDEPATTNIFEEYCKLYAEMNRIKTDSEKTAKKYNTMFEALRLWIEDDIEGAVEECDDDGDLRDTILKLLSMYGEVTITYGPGGYKRVYYQGSDDPVEVAPASTGEPLVDDFFAQKNIESKYEDNYGWLEPDGTFHPVEWCNHQSFAQKVIEERGWEDEFFCIESFSKGRLHLSGDFLTKKKGWVLLHNPGQGMAIVTREECRPLTKPQREFLFDYFYKRGQTAKAKEYLEDE